MLDAVNSSNQRRLSRLNRLIDQMNRRIPSLDRIPNPVTDMFEITDVFETTVGLMHLFEDRELERVQVVSRIHALLRKGDVFLITIGRKRTGWEIIWMSHAYLMQATH